jgi:prolipoprotein diacylglyceryltransferase
MRPEVVEWLGRFGIPAWLVPNYFMTAGMAGLIGCILVLRIARGDGAPIRVQAGALALGYVAALVGGSLFEMIRALPSAWEAGSWVPVLSAGRAAYGGLLASLLAATLYLRWKGESVAAFFDRVSVGAGVVFVVGRLGCFLAGCDYGLPTAASVGVRFPAGSLAAVDHAQRGWVPAGAASLPVHPTQLYEAALGAVSALAAVLVLRKGHRDGRAFLTWVSVYAAGRFLNEFLRGDLSRGLYGGLSTSQLVSLLLLLACGVVLVRHAHARRLAAVATAMLAVLVVGTPGGAWAQTTQTGQTPPGTAEPDARPAYVQRQGAGPALRLAVFPSLPPRPPLPGGMGFELDTTYRFRLSPSLRLELGLDARALRNELATHYGLGPVTNLVFETSGALELNAGLAVPYTWMRFDSPFFSPVGRLVPRLELGLQLALGGGVTLGGTVLSWSLLDDRVTGRLSSWEPRLWVGSAF